MKMTLIDVIKRQAFLASLVKKKLPYKLSYAISKNIKKLEDEIKIIEEGRIALLEEYAVKDENNKPVITDNRYELGDMLEKYTEEYKKYMDTDTDVEIYVVHFSVLEYDDSRLDVLTVEEIVNIDFMLEQ